MDLGEKLKYHSSVIIEIGCISIPIYRVHSLCVFDNKRTNSISLCISSLVLLEQISTYLAFYNSTYLLYHSSMGRNFDTGLSRLKSGCQ